MNFECHSIARNKCHVRVVAIVLVVYSYLLDRVYQRSVWIQVNLKELSPSLTDIAPVSDTCGSVIDRYEGGRLTAVESSLLSVAHIHEALDVGEMDE